MSPLPCEKAVPCLTYIISFLTEERKLESYVSFKTNNNNFLEKKKVARIYKFLNLITFIVIYLKLSALLKTPLKIYSKSFHSFICSFIHSFISFTYSVAPSVEHQQVSRLSAVSEWPWLSCQWCKVLLSSGVRVHYTAGWSSLSHRWPPTLLFTFISCCMCWN